MSGEIANQFTGLPIADLIGTPLLAASDSQIRLAQSTSKFIESIAFNDDKTLKLADFTYTGVDETGAETSNKISVPFISIVKVPNLAIEKVDIIFDMEVKTSSSERQEDQKSGSVDGKIGWGPFSLSVKGSISSTKESTRSTDTSAKYHIEVHAADQGMPEGLSRVLDILNSTIVPKKIPPAVKTVITVNTPNPTVTTTIMTE